MRLSLIAALLLLWTATSLHAQQKSDDPSLPLWELGALGAAATTPAYPGSDERSARALILPFVIYRGEILRADQSGIGARLLRSEHAELDLGFALSLPARSDDVPARAGMPDLGSLIEFGPRLKIDLAKPGPYGRLRLETPLRAAIELHGGLHAQGYAFEPRVVYETSDAQRQWTLGADLGLMAGSAKLNQFFYEVRPQYASADRPAYHAKGGLMMTRAGLTASRKLGPDWRVFGFMRYENYAGAANRDSPLFRQNSGLSTGFGFAWTLRRSAALASQ